MGEALVDRMSEAVSSIGMDGAMRVSLVYCLMTNATIF